MDLEALFEQIVPRDRLLAVIRAALDEDLEEAGDVTTASLDDVDRGVEAALAAREHGVVAGLPIVLPLLGAAAPRVSFDPAGVDGQRCDPDRVLGRLAGPIGEILRIERTLLNLLGRLCGVATTTRRFVDAVEGTGAEVCDTRKTTPGLRRLEKYAVRCGGGTLHRIGLFDAALYKDNHLAGIPAGELAATIAAAARRARAVSPLRFVEVEVDSVEQLERILRIEPGLIDIVLLDNMGDAALRRSVALRDRVAPSVRLEASGRVRLETIRAIAETGVDRISVGALTHSAPALDLALYLEPA